MGEMTNEEAIKHIKTWLYAEPDLPPMQVMQALELAVAALRAGGKDKDVPTMPAWHPLMLAQLRGMDGQCVKVVVDGVEPLKMLALVEAPEDEDCVLLRNNLGGVSEFYSDDDLREDGVKVYAYPPAHIDREAWMAEWVDDGECNHKPCRVRDREKWKKYKCSKCGYKAGRRTGQKFCPSCGRAMTPEAWAELEKRVRIKTSEAS